MSDEEYVSFSKSLPDEGDDSSKDETTSESPEPVATASTSLGSSLGDDHEPVVREQRHVSFGGQEERGEDDKIFQDVSTGCWWKVTLLNLFA
jgi:hypothetical protein